MLRLASVIADSKKNASFQATAQELIAQNNGAELAAQLAQESALLFSHPNAETLVNILIKFVCELKPAARQTAVQHFLAHSQNVGCPLNIHLTM